MPTTQELYVSLGIAEKKQERMARAVRRAERREEEEVRPAIHPDCYLRGHFSKGEWCVKTTPSGQRMSKCARCEQGFLLPT